MSIAPRSVRVRLTLWYLVILSLVLAGYSASVVISLKGWFQQDLDRRLERDLRRGRDLLDPLPGGGVRWNPDDDDAKEVKPFDRDVRIEAYLTNGERIEGTPWPGNEELSEAEFPEFDPGIASETLESGMWVRYHARKESIGGTPVFVRAIRSEESLHRRIQKLMVVMFWGFPGALLVAGIGGYFMARRSLRPVANMAVRAETITAERLKERLPVHNPHDELGRLAHVLNDLMARLDTSFEQLKRFTADASHELRTPLQALKTAGEMGLRDGADPSALRETISSMLEESDRLARLISTLLQFARADAQRVVLRFEDVKVSGLTSEVIETLSVLADEKAVTMSMAANPEVTVRADATVLRQAIANLIDNAIKFTDPGGRIDVRVSRKAAEACIEVQDTGHGIPEEHLPLIFERFYRVDRARSRATGGHGLGLSLTKWAVDVHSGRIEVESVPGRGSLFRICLPLEAKA